MGVVMRTYISDDFYLICSKEYSTGSMYGTIMYVCTYCVSWEYPVEGLKGIAMNLSLLLNSEDIQTTLFLLSVILSYLGKKHRNLWMYFFIPGCKVMSNWAIGLMATLKMT